MELVNEIVVTEADIDVFEHMNYKRYIDYFEKTRADWFIKIGLPYALMAEKGMAVVILKLDMQYIKEARLGDRLTIKTTPQKLGTKSFSLKQVIYNENDEIMTESFCTFVMLNTKTRKSMPVVDEIARHFPVSVESR